MTKLSKWLVISIIALLCQGCFTDHDKTNNDAIAVEVATIGTRDIPETVSAVGTLSSFNVATLSAQVEGQVVKIFFNNGQDVKKGDVIVQLEQETAQANVDSAKAALKLSQTTLARYLEVKEYGGVSTQMLNQAQADVATKMAALKTSTAALDEKQIVAPFNGTLGELKVNVGDYVTSGQAIVPLVNNDHLKVRYSVPQKFVSQLSINQEVDVEVNGINKIFQAKVTFISPAVDQNTRMVTVEATLDNQNGLLAPGMFAGIEQVVGVAKNSVIVPEQSITASMAGDFVYRITDGKAYSAKVELGRRIKGYAEVKSGLKPGDVVVTAGIQKLSDGTPVKIVTAQPTTDTE
ncbi:MAG: efflux RND transporter periplasmic adaptor subunit [Legionellales bacterium]|nr:efflux RND transporter periplasmic adaptor subunit [Legionellales bacterium]